MIQKHAAQEAHALGFQALILLGFSNLLGRLHGSVSGLLRFGDGVQGFHSVPEDRLAHEQFLLFLCDSVHPVVRPDREEAVKLVSHFNEQLRQVGWEIYEIERIAGRPRFAFRALTNHGGRAVLRARTVADSLDAGWMAKEIERLENGIDRDPALAIGTAKELVETCCKTILTKRGVTFSKSDDLGDLTKKLTKELRLVPEGISEEAKGAENIRLILRNLTQLANNLAQLRGLYGTGHGRDGNHRGLQSRHARLAVASAVAFIDFVSETYRQRENMRTE